MRRLADRASGEGLELGPMRGPQSGESWEKLG